MRVLGGEGLQGEWVQLAGVASAVWGWGKSAKVHVDLSTYMYMYMHEYYGAIHKTKRSIRQFESVRRAALSVLHTSLRKLCLGSGTW